MGKGGDIKLGGGSEWVGLELGLERFSFDKIAGTTKFVNVGGTLWGRREKTSCIPGSGGPAVLGIDVGTGDCAGRGNELSLFM